MVDQQHVSTDGDNGEDEARFEAIFRTHYEDLCKLAYYYVKNAGIAEDLVQDVFLNVWNLGEAMWEIECMKAYLCRSVRNTALKHLDREKTAQRWVNEEKHALPRTTNRADALLRSNELEREIKMSLDALPERRRQIFFLSRFQHLTYQEIANELEISVKTVETQMMRALKLLRERLDSYLVTTA